MRRIVLLAGATLLAVGGLLGSWGCGGSGGSPSLPAGFIDLANFQSAAVVVGQADFAGSLANQGGSAGANTLQNALGVADGSLWVADSQNHRVLRFSTIPTTNDASADLVVGQVNLTGATTGLSATRMNVPFSVYASGGKLFVGGFVNRRVLIWNTLPTTDGEAADVVVGQADFVSAAATVAQTGGGEVQHVFVVGTRLIVCERANHRVLVWNTIPTTNGAPADLVLGQADFTSNMSNRGGAVAANTFSEPMAAWSDGTRLFVADDSNNRVLVWNTFPTTNGQAADMALGQADLVSGGSAAGATGLSSPSHVSSIGTQVFVSDAGNNRILVWNSMPVVSGAPADVVLGQANFTNVAANDDDQDGMSDASPSARTLNGTAARPLLSATPIGNQLFVADYWNSRVLIFNGM